MLGTIRFILLDPLRPSQFDADENNQLHYKVAELEAADVISEDYVRRGAEKGAEENGVDGSEDG
jgi:hypothetical protein